MGLLKGIVIAAAAILAIVAIIAFREHNAILMTRALSGMMFLGVVEVVLKIREQGESILRISIGMILGGLVCFFIMLIPGIGIFLGPLLGGFIVALCAGFTAGWNLLPTTMVAMVFASAAGKTGLIFFLFGKLLNALGSSEVLTEFSTLVETAGVMAILPIIMAAIVLWVYLVVLCGIGALVGAALHPSPDLPIPKNMKPQVKQAIRQFSNAKTEKEEKLIMEKTMKSMESMVISSASQKLKEAKKMRIKQGTDFLRKKAKKIKKRGATLENLKDSLTTSLKDFIMPTYEKESFYDDVKECCDEENIQMPYSKREWLGTINTDLYYEIDKIVKEWEEKKTEDR